MIKAAVIGHPISHSRSPLIHGHWLKQLRIGGRYDKIDVAPEDLGKFLRNLPAEGYAGCNVTLPHKEAATHFVDQLDDRVRRTGSLNTIYVRSGLTYATSTDGIGFTENIRWRAPGFSFAGKSVTMLGAGGSARAIIDELLRQDVASLTLINRTLEKAEALGRQFGEKVHVHRQEDSSALLATTDLLVNTTSAGIADGTTLKLPLAALPTAALVTDINYVPLVTPFLREAERLGRAIVPGLGMLLHQAVPGFELWFGQRPKVTQELYDLVAADIEKAASR